MVDRAQDGETLPPSRGSRWDRVKEVAFDEARRFAIMFLYLWFMFGLFSLHERIVLRERGLSFSEQGWAIVNAFVLAKVMLVLEKLRPGRQRQDRPLIYPILQEALLFAFVFICFHVVEGVVVGLIEGKTFDASIPVVGGGGIAGVLCVAVIMFVALIPFFAFRELSRALGPERLNAILFRTRRNQPATGL